MQKIRRELMIIDAQNLKFEELNKKIRESTDNKIEVQNCYGLRYIGTGIENKEITIYGTAGNATGAYLNKTNVIVKGNAQDAIGDTMNSGYIIVEGTAGDATGYAIRGGRIFIRGNVGYRAGIHMKAYKEKQPVIIIGEKAGSFLGEYQAGGFIIVLNLSNIEGSIVGNFCATGMHGGKIFFRTDKPLMLDNPKLITRKATSEDMEEIKGYLNDYCEKMNVDKKIVKDEYYVIVPNSQNPFKSLYTFN
jgi:glutamate synthase domain-containing protein 3